MITVHIECRSQRIHRVGLSQMAAKTSLSTHKVVLR